MKPIAAIALLCLLLALSSTFSSCSVHRFDPLSSGMPAYWDRFEKEVDNFVNNALNGFSNAEEPKPMVSSIPPTLRSGIRTTNRDLQLGRLEQLA